MWCKTVCIERMSTATGSNEKLVPTLATEHGNCFPYCLFSTGGFQKAGKFVLSSKLWEHSTPSKTCDVLVTFPKGTEDYTVMWLLSRLRARVQDVDVHVRQMAHSPVYGFYLTSSFEVTFNLPLKARLKLSLVMR